MKSGVVFTRRLAAPALTVCSPKLRAMWYPKTPVAPRAKNAPQSWSEVRSPEVCGFFRKT